ncbi:hypothetical protein KIL84_014882 [Mauremys mutica]|uniref:Uncharacterized protein n=1 Tax=Mauremys mutica TaxID=74926 RepID=A0A9D3XRJ4_9SAUR|nr:hypothetical protein KIL84_014882 [Mauremys mutica]
MQKLTGSASRMASVKGSAREWHLLKSCTARNSCCCTRQGTCPGVTSSRAAREQVHGDQSLHTVFSSQLITEPLAHLKAPAPWGGSPGRWDTGRPAGEWAQRHAGGRVNATRTRHSEGKPPLPHNHTQPLRLEPAVQLVRSLPCPCDRLASQREPRDNADRSRPQRARPLGLALALPAGVPLPLAYLRRPGHWQEHSAILGELR